MAIRELESSIFGRDVSFQYSERWVGYALLGLRLMIGWTFFLPGVRHSWDPDWSVRGLLVYGIPEGNPFASIWTTMGTEWAWLLTPLNSLGLTFVGLALILGAFVRLSAVFGAMMMAFYWAASLPLENGFLVNYHTVYGLLLFGIGAFGAGRIFGLDAKLEQLDIVKKYPRLKLLLG